MADRTQIRSISLTLVVILFSVGVGVATLSGIAVAQTGHITVVDLDTNEPVTEGETLVVTATLECKAVVFSISAASGCDQDVSLLIAGDGRQPFLLVPDSRRVVLDFGERSAFDFTWKTGPNDAGTHRAEVIPENGDSKSTSVTVIEPANFAVEIEATNSPVTEGEPLNVTATITNTGDEADTQEIVLTIDGNEAVSTTVALKRGESQTVTLTWETRAGDAGDHEAGVVSEDDSDRTPVTVLEPANFAVRIDATNSPVTEGDSLNVTATITNTGDEADTQEIVLTIDGNEADSTTVALDGGESEPVTLTWETEEGDAGDHEAGVVSEDDSDRIPVTVLEPANFSVRIDSTFSPVIEAEPLDVTATVTNTGDEADTQEIVLTIDGSEEDSTTVLLNGGDSETVTLTWETGAGDAGEHTATVASEDGKNSTDVIVGEPANFAVEIDATNSPVTEGEPLDVTATITNTGDEADTQEIVLTIDGNEADSTTMSLAEVDSQVVRLTWNTNPGDAGEHTVEVASESDSDAEGVSIVAAGAGDGGDSGGDVTFEVSIDDTQLPETAGEPLVVDATIENTGSRSDTQIVRLSVNGEERDSREVTLAAGESRSVMFRWPDPANATEYNLRLASEDDFDESSFQLGGADGEGFIDGAIDVETGGVLLLLLLLLLLLIYYYVRRRRMYEASLVSWDDDSE